MLYARRLLSNKVVMPGLCFPGQLSSYLRGISNLKKLPIYLPVVRDTSAGALPVYTIRPERQFQLR